MFRRTVLGLCLAGSLTHHPAHAAAVDKASEIRDCLATASVRFDEAGSTSWKQDAAPFNLRLTYKPVSIAVVESVEQIQQAVRCAAKVGLKVTPKCGGHSYASFGLGGEDGHLVLEMTRMNRVVLDPKTNVASVGGGSRLGHVAAELYAQGKRAISHGTCPG